MKQKRAYEPPRIVFTEKIEARAMICIRADDTTCGEGPIQS
jgi:hypothetical protein